jgi:glycosyltransferase involved in cell wall biosynthesis
MGVRALLSDLVMDSRSLQVPYALAADGRAAWARRRGRALSAAEALLGAWRLLGNERFGAKRRRIVRELIEAQCFRGRQLGRVAENGFLREFEGRPEARRSREHYAAFAPGHRVRLRYPRPNDDPERQGDLMVLKAYDPTSGEKGVLFIMYDEVIRRLPALFDLRSLASEYVIVLEPSWWGYQNATFLLYLGADLDVVVLAQCRDDYEFLLDLNSNIVPVRLGAGDWVDPTRFRPKEGVDRTFDLVMVSAWNPNKRHKLLFRTLRTLRARYGETLSVALVGYPSVWSRNEIVRLMRRYGVEGQCTIFENIPHAEVARVVADSRAYVLLSRREGANRALYESLFCGTPVIVHRHHRGVNVDIVIEEVGRLADDQELPEVILDVVRNSQRFRPSQWAAEHTGWQNSTRLLEEVLKSLAQKRGTPWTSGIAAKKNAPNLMYAEAGAYQRFEVEYERLARHMVR